MARRRLYNWQFAQVKGKEMRLEAELIAHKGGAPVPRNPPLFSHDATLQSYFNKAWQRVSQCNINRHLGLAETPQGTDLIAKIRSLKQCHFSQ
ncbi:hypothetical protein [Vibrio parahaemolyticus]|uniref:hypothetical protein n=1 Tax=Vibrio parahaemolyticus TaxID=670 RepID=UPI000C86A226|nr:hypothetical protein [Vibrio parahaemolyticus]PMS49924.1 hypothetical protein C1S89_09000 [Vibrio parahaemolyticus]PMS54995.1 hypothetical protein C1T11_00175 [Vibrio parahaemolyticus]PMS60324.1 hypothetical protein C1T09_00225 [Vibrio parahaemolyticus]PMS90412.1 hypothetical protein C1S90_00225 [Vibrio parahaemolyticus]PMS94168.1 hypothetical protein C1T06_10405 [Vibrio parahaemolyticus]